MSKNLAQIYAANPITTIGNTDVMYVVTTDTTDAAINGANLKALFASSTLPSADFYVGSAGNVATGVAMSGDAALANTGAVTVSKIGGVGISLAGSFTTSGAFAVTQTYTAGTNVTFPTSGTLATTSQLPTLPLSLSNGGTNANLTASNGGIFYSTATAGAILSGTATANQVLLSGSSTTPAWSTATYPSTTTINQILYSSSNNVVGGITAANGGILVSGATGIPSFLANPAASGKALLSVSGNSPAYSTPTYPSASGSAGTILRSDGTNNIYSTSTFSDTYTASNLLYSNGSNTVTGLATGNNGLLVTSNTGVPSILAGPGSTGKILQSNSASAPSFSTATFPSTGGAAGNILISDGTNYISSTSLWPNTVGSSGKLLQSNGTSNVYTTATYPTTATSTGTLLRADGTNWVKTTSTFSDTYSASNLLYSNGANTVTGLATANNGILVTSNTGVPSISSTLPSAVIANIPQRLLGIQVFTTSGSNIYTPSAGVNNAFVMLWGGGGGGGSTNSAVIYGASGGSGALAASYVAVSGNVTIVIGAGGTGGVANNGTAATAGSNTTYATTTIVAAAGGAAQQANGNPGTGGASSSCTGTITISGTAGSANPNGVVGIILGGGNAPWLNGMAFLQGAGAANGPANSAAGGGAGNSATNGGNGGSGYAIVFEYS